MSALLPIVRPFDLTYEAWTQRDATHDEILASLSSGPICLSVNDRLIASVTNEYEAAEYMARQACDNGLEFHIDRALAEDPGFRQWLEAMPRTVPPALERYQLEYPLEDLSDVASAIDAHGAFLSPGQILFHGGAIDFPENGRLVTSKPLSTTFCPQVALRQAEWCGKAFEANVVCLYVLRVCSSTSKVYVFDPQASEKGHEKEVLFGTGATLTLRSARNVRSDYTVHRAKDYRTESKPVRFIVFEVDIS